jgi:hypothetical protein
MFEQHSAGDLTQYVHNIEAIFETQGQKSHAGKVARMFRPLYETMNLYAPIARTMVQADPTSSALILGGITCIISVSQRFLNYQEKIVEMLSEMGRKLEILFRYGREIYYNNEDVLRPLLSVFADILEFCSAAWRMFRDKNGDPRSSAKTFFTSLGKSYETKFGEVIRKFELDLKDFEERALLCYRQDVKQFQTDSRGFQKDSRGFQAEVRDFMNTQKQTTAGQNAHLAYIRKTFSGVKSQRQIQDQEDKEAKRTEAVQEMKEQRERLARELSK